MRGEIDEERNGGGHREWKIKGRGREGSEEMGLEREDDIQEESAGRGGQRRREEDRVGQRMTEEDRGGHMIEEKR